MLSRMSFSTKSQIIHILFSKSTQHDVIKEIYGDDGNFVIIVCKINTEVFAFISVYGPNSDQPNFFSNIFARLKDVEIDHTIIGGI